MEQKNMSTTYVPLQYPYQIIKYKKDIAMQIGTLIVTTQKEGGADGQDYHIETHSHPVVTYDNKANAKPNSQLAKYQFLEGVVWNNVEVKDVITICLSDARLSWREFIDFLEEDLSRDESAEAPCIDAFWKISKLAGGVAPPEESDLEARFFIDTNMSYDDDIWYDDDDEELTEYTIAQLEETNWQNLPLDEDITFEIDDCDLLSVGTSPMYSNNKNSDDFCFFAKYNQDHPDTWKSAIKEQIEQYKLIFQYLGGDIPNFHIFYRTDHYIDGYANQQVDDFIDGLNASEEFTEFLVWLEGMIRCDKWSEVRFFSNKNDEENKNKEEDDLYGGDKQNHPDEIPILNEFPAELFTPKAQVLWQKLRDKGFIEPQRYSLAKNVSANQATYIADRMANKLNIKKKKWKVFQQLWGIRNMAQFAGGWQQTGKLPPRAKEIDKLMK